MIKGRGQMSGKPMVMLGLDGENMTRLMAEEPIIFSLTEFGLDDIRVLIIGGRTEQHMVDQLAKGRLLPEGFTIP